MRSTQNKDTLDVSAARNKGPGNHLLLLSEDYYELLGISRDASHKDIRKAFKKLALKLHPDKNPDDPEAHERFTTINKAYEVLKDEELRKKYDLYGEEGLKDDHFGGGHYQSWNYFNEEFGIYDDDPEIITLSHSDFQVSVEGSEDIWFINFYSPFCSHCHDLAPTWREVAQELEGVIRFGAVNCQEEWNLCRRQGITSYPSIVLYPTHEFHRGSRGTRSLVKFILNSLEVNLFDLWEGNFEKHINKGDEPWLIDFCVSGGDCLDSDTRIKLSAVLDNLVNIGTMDCEASASLCKEVGYSDDLVYFKGDVGPKKGEVIDSLDSKEIISMVLKKLPDPVNVDLTTFEVGHVDCSKETEICQRVHITKYPMVALFKTHGYYEWHHGRFTAHDIAVFAKESASSSVQTLGPEDFPAKVNQPEHPFFVDFFAPYNIRSYPTTILYNNSIPHQFDGHHTAADLVEFIENTLKPSVVQLTPETFQSLVAERKKGETWLVDYYAPWCGPCNELAPDWNKLAKEQGVNSYPTIRLYPHHNQGARSFVIHRGWRDVDSLYSWAFQHLPSLVTQLNYQAFLDNVVDINLTNFGLYTGNHPFFPAQPCEYLSSKQKEQLLNMAYTVHKILDEFVREHSLLPWDNDVDFGFNGSGTFASMNFDEFLSPFEAKGLKVYHKRWITSNVMKVYSDKLPQMQVDLVAYYNYSGWMKRAGLETWILALNYNRYQSFPARFVEQPLPQTRFVSLRCQFPEKELKSNGIYIQTTGGRK
ncbi:DnaJ sub C member 10 [Desmophyllum pertusum]|uniref:DnaJ homolog subfamily C member 10 n=1 Tax=Desmophyllum pertusum TaxID=174260 RepID=A0A9W9YJZ3_9CNID|nr:DnaJ sub C member 10 [Desmophyllum pertusum]